MEMAGRGFSGSYRFGYQGSEKDNEVSGDGNSYTTEFRQLDPRLGRWFSVDPVFQPWQSPYTSMDNNPIGLTDKKGDKTPKNKEDKFVYTRTEDGLVYNIWKTKDGQYYFEIYNPKDQKSVYTTARNYNNMTQLGSTFGKFVAIFTASNRKTKAEYAKKTAAAEEEKRKAAAAAKINSLKVKTTKVEERNKLTYKSNDVGGVSTNEASATASNKSGEVQVGDINAKASVTSLEAKGTANAGKGNVNLGATATVTTVNAQITLGDRANHSTGSATGTVGNADAQLQAGVLSGQDGKYGFIVNGSAEAQVVNGKVTAGGTVYGVGGTANLGTCAACAEIGAGAAGYYDSNTGLIHVRLSGEIGLFFGLEAEVDFTFDYDYYFDD
jgi:RHS repeat-associated protein